MASDGIGELISLGPFVGIDYNSGHEVVKPGFAVSATNADPGRVPGALLPVRGRTQFMDLSAYVDLITVVSEGTTAGDVGLYLVQGTKGSTLVTMFVDPNPASPTPVQVIPAFTNGYSVTSYDQAIQYASVMYTNGGQRFFLDQYPSSGNNRLRAYQWQYPFNIGSLSGRTTKPPGQNLITLSLAPTGATDAPTPGIYYYVLTQQTIMPDGSISETSTDPITFQYPATITVTVTGPILVTQRGIVSNRYLFTGSNRDGTTYTTNLYRQSSNQAGYLFVANIATNAPYLDSNSDADLVGNPSLIVHRDPPPTTSGLPPPVGQNEGAIGIHKNRVWVFVTIDDADSGFLPQNQLWYSNVDRPWEFNNTSQVLLMQSDVTSVPINNPNGITNYDSVCGNEPKAIAEVGSILCAWKKRETWAVYGDSASDFVQRLIFNIGCVSKQSVTPFLGGVGWLSEGGPYYFDGSAPNYVGDKIHNYLRAIPGPFPIATDGVNALAQIHATGSFRDFTWYLSFPDINQTIGYSTNRNEWGSILGISPSFAPAIVTSTTQPDQWAGTSFGRIVAARGPILDYWFSDASFDLGEPQSYSWRGPLSESGKPDWRKRYQFLTLHVPPGVKGQALLELFVDDKPPVAWNIADLSTLTRHIKTIGVRDVKGNSGAVLGYMAYLVLTVTGAVGQPAPQIYGARCWGQLEQRLELRT